MSAKRAFWVVGGFSYIVVLFLSAGAAMAQQTERKFTEWGWPLPYEKVSQSSIDWLKAKGWWPLKIAYQIDPQTFIMVRKGFLSERGVEAEAVGFLAGPPMLEAFAGKRIHAVNAGNFPTTTMIDKEFGVVGITHLHMGWRHGTFAPVDSPLTKLADLKKEKLGRQGIIGIRLHCRTRWDTP
jgi:sulfonate transport system substrate-binding protein